jgi:hypothetical protein
MKFSKAGAETLRPFLSVCWLNNRLYCVDRFLTFAGTLKHGASTTHWQYFTGAARRNTQFRDRSGRR